MKPSVSRLLTITAGSGATHLLLAIAGAGLGLGLLASYRGAAGWAQWFWLAGSLPTLAALSVTFVRSLLRHETGIDVIALISMAGAVLLEQFLTGAVIALMLASGRALEGHAEMRARRQMTELLSRVPRTANRYDSSGLTQVPISSVSIGDRLLVRTGETVPVDGKIESGVAELDESAITGESVPARRGIGDSVRSGTINNAAPFDLVATTTAAESTLAGIVRLVDAAQQSKAPAARLADRYALLFVPFSIGLAAFAWMLSGDSIRALAVLVVATPCPLILAVPVAIVAGMSRCAARGVLVKGGGMLEKLAEARALFFDKTGTLTRGRARLTSIESDSSLENGELLRLAASLDQASPHVIAEAIVDSARARGLRLSVPSNVEEVPGAGIRGTVDNHDVILGSHAFVVATSSGSDWASQVLRQVRNEGAAAVFVAIDGKLSGALLLVDEIRLDTPRALRLLRKRGIERIVMLTGDHRAVAETVGTLLGVDDVFADCTPAQKLDAVKRSCSEQITIMVGDGVNDAPALAAADVGVAMGARGTAAASEAGGVVLLADRLDRLADAIHIAQGARGIAVQSVAIGMGLSFLAMTVAAAGYLAPLTGAILQEAIDVMVILNALRVLRIATTPNRSGELGHAHVDRLAREHAELTPLLDRLTSAANRLTTIPSIAVREELEEIMRLIRNHLLPHERSDDVELYPVVADLLGGDDPMAAMSRTHLEIVRLANLLGRMMERLPTEGPDPYVLREIQRVLDSLEAILRLHFLQEEEIYHALKGEPEQHRRQ